MAVKPYLLRGFELKCSTSNNKIDLVVNNKIDGRDVMFEVLEKIPRHKKQMQDHNLHIFKNGSYFLFA